MGCMNKRQRVAVQALDSVGHGLFRDAHDLKVLILLQLIRQAGCATSAWLFIRHSMGVLASSPANISVAVSTVQSGFASAAEQIRISAVIPGCMRVPLAY